MTENPNAPAIAHGHGLMVPAPDGVAEAIAVVMTAHADEFNAALEQFGVSLDALVLPTWMQFVRFGDVRAVAGPGFASGEEMARFGAAMVEGIREGVEGTAVEGGRVTLHIAGDGGGVLCGTLAGVTHVTNGPRFADCSACVEAYNAPWRRYGRGELTYDEAVILGGAPASRVTPVSEGRDAAVITPEQRVAFESFEAVTSLPLLGDAAPRCSGDGCGACAIDALPGVPRSAPAVDGEAVVEAQAAAVAGHAEDGCAGCAAIHEVAQSIGSAPSAPAVDGVYVTDQPRDPESFGERIAPDADRG